jgi:hypothetical protein
MTSHSRTLSEATGPMVPQAALALLDIIGDRMGY